MEDNEPKPSTTSPPAERTAQALRELHDRARTAMAAQRDRMGQLEARLTQQLDSIADTLAEQLSTHDSQPADAPQPPAELEQLRAELEKTRLDWNAEREAWEAERAELNAADHDQSQSLEERIRELESRQQALDERATELNQQDRELCERKELLDAHAAQSAEKQSELFAAESALEKQRGEAAEREAAIQKRERELEQKWEEVTARQQTLESGQLQLAADREALAGEREKFEQQRGAVAAQGESEESETAAKLASVELQLITERQTWDRERASVEEQRRLLAKERDDLSTALEAARGELATARSEAAAVGDYDKLQQKFDLALEDVQRLRARVAELEQELDSRPEVDETDSVELVHLRAERDAMAERISELEQQSAAQEDVAPSEDTSELQRRFELAVEDVRDLKKKNAELEAALASVKSGSGAAAAPTGGGGSWEAMKRKMLANLSDEGDDVDEDRHEERAKIEDTIRATDAALASKDREIAELKSRIADGKSQKTDSEEALQQLLDSDEVIAEHRARIAKLELEVTAKLREAELELSVERAKITRETAHLEQLRAEIESQRQQGVVPVAPGTPQQPKRRWLSKLGLNGEEEQ